MRKTKFRGKHIETGKWIYGDLLQDGKSLGVCIYDRIADDFISVALNTIGQHSGLEDNNSEEIYEGDIIKTDEYIGVIKIGQYSNHQQEYHLGIYIDWINDKYSSIRQDVCFWLNERNIEVIGNIHDNPELLNKE